MTGTGWPAGQARRPRGPGTPQSLVAADYQACVWPQCGQRTDVETCSSNTRPHAQLYIARSSDGGPLRRSARYEG
jgi:hypothetical protein